MLFFQDQRDIYEENERLKSDIETFQRQIVELNETLHQAHFKQSAFESNSTKSNNGLQILLTENRKLVHDFQGVTFFRQILKIYSICFSNKIFNC